jgi:hypothetical protein
MSDLYDLLEKIRKRPPMYLGYYSIFNLQSFLAGRYQARHELGIPKTEQERDFEEFQDWIQKKYGIQSSQSWARIINFYSSDEREALNRFFELIEEFLERHNNSETDVKSEEISLNYEVTG